MSEKFEEKFKEMIELSNEVNKVIFRDLLCEVDESHLKYVVEKENRNNPLDFIHFRAYCLERGYCEEDIKEKYKKIVDKILASGSPALRCFKELALISDSYLVQYAYYECKYHIWDMFGGCGCYDSC